MCKHEYIHERFIMKIHYQKLDTCKMNFHVTGHKNVCSWPWCYGFISRDFRMAVICANTFFSDCYRHILSIADNLYRKKNSLNLRIKKLVFCAINLTQLDVLIIVSRYYKINGGYLSWISLCPIIFWRRIAVNCTE